MSTSRRLENVFRYGQNDFQPMPMPSVSVGDVAVLPGGSLWVCESFGWAPVNPNHLGSLLALLLGGRDLRSYQIVEYLTRSHEQS